MASDNRAAASRSSARRCGFPECTKTAKPGGLCISHGGGKKCSVEGCTTSVVSRGFCVAHGGGKRCQREGCAKSAQTGGFCWIHGGGKKCGHDGCTKRAQSGGACISHGGGKRCRIDGCNKVVQYEGLCVGHGGYRKCLSMNCAKKALPNGYCHSHGGNARCHYADCAKKAVQGGYCGQHKDFGSPQQIAHSRTSSLGESPSFHRNSLQDIPTISPLMPLASAYQQPPRDWSRAIAEAKSGHLSHHDSDQRTSVTDDAPLFPPRAPANTPPQPRLPSVLELQRNQAWAKASANGTFVDRIAPLLTAVASASARDVPRAFKRDMETESESEADAQSCGFHGCSRFAKVEGLCLVHHQFRSHPRRPSDLLHGSTQRRNYATLVREVHSLH